VSFSSPRRSRTAPKQDCKNSLNNSVMQGGRIVGYGFDRFKEFNDKDDVRLLAEIGRKKPVLKYRVEEMGTWQWPLRSRRGTILCRHAAANSA
jgi:hypothetical protein